VGRIRRNFKIINDNCTGTILATGGNLQSYRAVQPHDTGSKTATPDRQREHRATARGEPGRDRDVAGKELFSSRPGPFGRKADSRAVSFSGYDRNREPGRL